MARDHRKYLLGIDKESGEICGFNSEGQLVGVRPLTLREIKVFLNNNPGSNFVDWKIEKSGLKTIPRRRPKVFFGRS